jgi:glycosyltransferase involved in cell wall biosynthesis
MAATDPTAFTVIIPAHNEGTVIARCLKALLADAPADSKMQVIVAANGCNDDTVAIARKSAPDAIVLDLPVGSKTGAMNAANREALHFPRIYLDADVQCSYSSLLAVAQVLHEPGVMAAAPALRMDLSRSNWLARAYYRVWLTQPYVKRALVGSGCFGLSQAAYERIGDFPPITGDDIWVYSRFTESERRNISTDAQGQPVWFLVSPPRSAADQIRVETRRRLGNEQLLREYPSPHYTGSNNAGDLRDALREGASVLDVIVYLAIKAMVRLRVHRTKRKQKDIVWERDLAAREV